MSKFESLTINLFRVFSNASNNEGGVKKEEKLYIF